MSEAAICVTDGEEVEKGGRGQSYLIDNLISADQITKTTEQVTVKQVVSQPASL